MENRLHYRIAKIFRWFYWRLSNSIRYVLLKMINPGITSRGFISLERGVRFLCSENGSINLFGPIWIHRYCSLHANRGRLFINKNTSIGPFTIIASMEKVTIGKDCMIAEYVSIRDHDHEYENAEIPMREQGWIIKPVEIGNNVWIGAKVTILKGCNIGDNVIIGANSVVTHNIPSNSIALGSPARVMRALYDEEVSGITRNE
jgi:acetyltransferase-like isoleucine patch superfamily enzyme